jgi:hypothetical protein
MAGRPGTGYRRTATAVAALATLVAAGCVQGRMLIGPVQLRPPEDSRPTGLSVVVEGLPRMESDKYQAFVEREVARAVRDSGLFHAVYVGTGDVQDRDLVLRIHRATAAYDRRVNAAYFPLALATLTLYIWVGGPIHTDTEFYDITVSLFDADGTHLFDVQRREKHTHWINLYNAERYEFRCQGPNAGQVISGLVEELGQRLAAHGAGGTRAGAAAP